MAVTERLMAAGQWDLVLSPETPKRIRDLLDFFGHVYVFDTPMRPGLSDASLIATSRWGGIVRRRQTPWKVGGVNMIGWLGDEDGKGPILETLVGGGGSVFSGYVGAILAQCPAVSSGVIVSGGLAFTISYQWITARAALDHAASVFGYEYRVNKNASLDAGGAASLFVTTPVAVAMRRSSGRDQGIVGLPVTALDVSIDAEEYTTRQLVQDASSVWTGYAVGQLVFRSLGSDTDGTLSQWSQVAGVWSIASNLLSSPTTADALIVAPNTKMTDGTYTVRFKWVTNTAPGAVIHCDGTYANLIVGGLSSGAISLIKRVVSVETTVASTVVAPVSGNFYWLQVAASGTTYSVSVFNDSGGAIGTQLGTTVTGTIADTGLQSGIVGLRTAPGTTAATTHGGAFPNVCTAGAPTTYKDLFGNLVNLTKPNQSTLTPTAAALGLARKLALDGGALRNEIALTSDEFDIDRDVNVGDWIWVYDPDGNMVDVTNQVRYRGSVIFPVKLRVMAITWPIERGMGILYRDKAGVWTDLTPYVEYESPGVTVEVGAKTRALLTKP